MKTTMRQIGMLALAVSLLAGTSGLALAVTFTTFVQQSDLNAALSNNAAIGFAYAGNKFVGSVYFGANNNQLYDTNLNGGGGHALWHADPRSFG
jgi:hypothetical protein